jgi:hypothetical protein
VNKLEKSEFLKVLWTGDFKVFFELADSVNIDKGENIYHTCHLCNYVTKTAHTFEELAPVDDAIANHLWEKHREEATRAVRKYESGKIASARGQMKLDEVVK